MTQELGTAEAMAAREQLLGNRPQAVLDLLKARAAAPGAKRTDGRKLGLVVEGGGMRGVLSAGSLFALELAGYRDCFDAVFALSAGAVNAAYFLSGQGGLGISVYFDDISNRRFFNPWRFWKMVDVDYVYDTVVSRIKPLDQGALRRCRQEFYVTATEVTAGNTVLLDVKDPEVPVPRSLKASSALPILYNRRVRVNGRYYVDGGVGGGLPIALAIEHGCTDLIVLLSRPCVAKAKPAGRLDRWAFRLLLGFRYPALYHAFLKVHIDKTRNRDLATGEVALKGVNIACVCPDLAGSGVSRTTTNRSKLLAGALSCSRTMAALLNTDPGIVENAFREFQHQ